MSWFNRWYCLRYSNNSIGWENSTLPYSDLTACTIVSGWDDSTGWTDAIIWAGGSACARGLDLVDGNLLNNIKKASL